jgi:hypothetical protein
MTNLTAVRLIRVTLFAVSVLATLLGLSGIALADDTCPGPPFGC